MTLANFTPGEGLDWAAIIRNANVNAPSSTATSAVSRPAAGSQVIDWDTNQGWTYVNEDGATNGLNPWFDPDYEIGQPYERFDHTKVGSGIPYIRSWQEGASELQALRDAGSPVWTHAQEWISDRGFDPDNLTPHQATDALDWVARNKQRKNKRTNKFGDSLLGKVLSVAAPVAANFIPGLQGWGGVALKGALGGATSGAIRGNGDISSILRGAGLGAAGGVAAKGFSNILRGDSLVGREAFTNPDALGIDAADLYNPESLGGATGTASGLGVDANDFFPWAQGSIDAARQATGNQVPGGRTGITTPGVDTGSFPKGPTATPNSGFVNPDGLGLAPSDLYSPTSLSEPLRAGASNAAPTSLSAVKNALPSLVTAAAPVVAAELTEPLNPSNDPSKRFRRVPGWDDWQNIWSGGRAGPVNKL